MNALIAGLLASALVLLATALGAAQNPPIYSPVIIGMEQTTGAYFEVRPDGTGFRNLMAGGMLSEGPVGGRFLLQGERDGTEFYVPDPSGDRHLTYWDLVVYDENGANRTVLTTDRTLQRYGARWSHNGRWLAYSAVRWSEPAGVNPGPSVLIESGVFLAEVIYVGERPVGISEYLLEDLTPAKGWGASGDLLPVSVFWSYDDQRLAFDDKVRTISGAVCQVVIDGRSTAFQFSPVDDRVVIRRLPDNNQGTVQNAEIFVATVPPATNCPLYVTSRQITNKANGGSSLSKLKVEWSPDGRYVAFTGLKSGATGYDIYKLAADGSGKATALTEQRKTGASYWITQWTK